MTDTRPRRVLGGELESPSPVCLGLSSGLRGVTKGFQGAWAASGRAGLFLILERLRSRGVRHVHLPAYLCESVLLPVQALGFDLSFFPVDASLRAWPDPPPGAAVVLIHYFGWLNPAVAALRSQAESSLYLVEDFSHAFLSDWGELRAPAADEGRFLFFSARKLGPAPLGGWCTAEAEPGQPSTEMELAAWRSLAARLLKREYLAFPDLEVDPKVEELYLSAFEAVESFLNAHPDEAALPAFVLDFIAGLNWQEIAERRRSNWTTLHGLLAGTVEPLAADLPAGAVPLGYVVRLDEKRRDDVRRALADRRIFCPVHWPLPKEVDRRRFPEARRLSRTLLTLPVDQRYGEAEMEIVASALKQTLG
ncbi:MAG TPA: hypothetical protein VM492_15265 [Sumerlaeia bacterium]|nr:hypothetical protein [Sumerlaeia bacterium]